MTINARSVLSMWPVAAFAILMTTSDVTARTVEKQIFVVKSSANIRADSTAGSTVITEVAAGARMEIIARAYDWFQVRLPRSTKGYVSSQYIDDNGLCTASNLNIRSSPALDAPVLGRIPKGKPVVVVGRKGDWYVIDVYPYAKGWVHSQLGQSVTETVNEVDLLPVMAPPEPIEQPVPVPAPEAPVVPVTVQPVVMTPVKPADTTIAQRKEQERVQREKVKADARAERDRLRELAKKEKDERRQAQLRLQQERRQYQERAKKEAEDRRRQEEERLRMEAFEREREREESQASVQSQAVSQVFSAVPDAGLDIEALIRKHQEIKKLAQQKLDGVRQTKLDTSYFRNRVQDEQTPLISGVISYARQTSTPARYKITVDTGYVLVEIADSDTVEPYMNRQVDVWGEVKQKSGYTYITAAKLRLAE